MKIIILISTFFLFTININSQISKQWEHTYQYFGMTSGNSTDFVINNLNEPVVLCQQWGWEQTPIVHIYKLNVLTGSVIWDRSPSNSMGQFIFSDAQNNIFVCGRVKEGFTWKTPFVTKYNNSGNQIFYKTDPTDSYGMLYSACFDSSSNVYMLKNYLHWVKATKYDSSGNISWTNYFSKTDTFSPGSISVNSIKKETILDGWYRLNNQYNIFLLKIDSNGNSLDTAQVNINSLNVINFYKLKIDQHSNIYLTGKYTNQSNQLGTFIYKLSPSLDTLWREIIASNQENVGSCLNIQNDGTVIINDVSGLIKYDSLGNTLWNFSGNKYYGVITGKDNFIYACGSTATNRYLTTKLNQNGGVVWSITEESSSLPTNNLISIKIDTLSNVYVHGSGSGPAYIVSTIKYAQLTGISPQSNNIPNNTELLQNYPNPFNPSTNIIFKLNKPGNIILAIYDVKGREILRLEQNSLKPGAYSYNWNSLNHASGIYFFKFTSGSYSDTKKMILLK